MLLVSTGTVGAEGLYIVSGAVISAKSSIGFVPITTGNFISGSSQHEPEPIIY